MATIYEKTANDNCLILDTREALVYPFDFGDDWSEIRIGAIVSVTTNTGDNQVGVTEFFSAPTNTNDRMYFGLKDGSERLPHDGGTSFIGMAGIGLVEQRVQQGSTRFVYGVATSGDYATYSQMVNFEQVYIGYGTWSTGESRYAQFNSLRITRTGANYTVSYSHFDNNNSDPYTNLNTRQMLRTSTYGNAVTGLAYATGMNNFFCYFPWFNNRIRLHNLVVEKFA